MRICGEVRDRNAHSAIEYLMTRILWSGANDFAPVVAIDDAAIILDLGPGARLGGVDIRAADTARLSALIDDALSSAGTDFAFGRYGEPRELYHGDLFAGRDGGERRTVHLGIDLFCRAGTTVHAPLDGVVQFAENNRGELDYGPVLILRHTREDGSPFYTLYGHLSTETLEHTAVGQPVSAGQEIARIGNPPDNGNWPPHLHLQIINDLLGMGADFPGVAFRSEWSFWSSLSPSPAAFFPGIDPGELEYGAL